MNRRKRQQFHVEEATFEIVTDTRCQRGDKPIAFLPKYSRNDLDELAQKEAIIKGKTFYLENDGPIVLNGISNLLIRDCRFVWQKKQRQPLLEIRDSCDGVQFVSCEFIYAIDAELPT